MKRRIALFSTMMLTGYACAEASDGDPFSSSVDAGVAVDGAVSTVDGAVDTSTPPIKTGDAAAAQGFVLNEISPSDEWVELVNGSATAVDVSGFIVADMEKEGGAPKLDEAAHIPDGTILSPHSYLIVQGGELDAGQCVDGGQSYCVNAKFGVSNKSGETIFLLDKSNAILGQLVYPPSAVVTKGNTWGRSPNVTGDFGETQPTPGAPNIPK